MNIGILKSLFSGAAEKDMNESNVPGSAPHDPSIYGNHHISEPHSFAKVNPLHFTPKPGMTDGEVWDMAMTMSNRRKMSGTDVYGAGMWSLRWPEGLNPGPLRGTYRVVGNIFEQ